MWNTILFDLDGTLTDSGEGIMKSVRYALQKEFQIEVEDYRQLREFVGPPLKDQFMAYASLSEEDGDRAVRAYRERYTAKGIYENRLYGGIRELLAALSQAGFRMALSSSKPTQFCVQILRHFGIDSYFTCVVGSEMNGRRVEKAEVLEETLRVLGLSDRKNEAVLIGDRKFDVEGAKAVGIDCIGVTYGYGTREELERAWPVCICDTVEEVRNVLLGQLRAAGVSQIRSQAPAVSAPYAGAIPSGAMPGQAAPASPYASGVPGQGAPSYPAPPAGFVYIPPAGVQGAYPQGAPYVQPVRKKSRAARFFGTFWYILWPFLLMFGVQIMIVSAFSIGASVMDAVGFPEIGDLLYQCVTDMALAAGVIDFLSLIVFVPLFLMDEKRRKEKEGGRNSLVRNRFSIVDVLLLAVAAIGVSMLANTVVSTIVQLLNPDYTSPQAGFFSASLPVQLICLGVIGPVFEEFLFRGMIFRRVRDRLGFVWALALSSLIFAAVHQDLPTDIIVLFSGLLCGLVYEKYGTILAPMAVHIATNTCATILNNIEEQMSDTADLIFVVSSVILAVFAIVFILLKREKVNRI